MIIDKIMPVIASIISVSSILTSMMFPNKKLNRSSVNPPDRIISNMPSARPDESNMATVASAGILADCRTS